MKETHIKEQAMGEMDFFCRSTPLTEETARDPFLRDALLGLKQETVRPAMRSEGL